MSDAVKVANASFNDIAKVMRQLRENQLHELQMLPDDDPAMLLRLAKADHIVWVDKVIRYALFNQTSLTEGELKDHTQCRLGKFLDSDRGQTMLAGKNNFAELYNYVHPKVHQLGRDIFNNAKQGNHHEALEPMIEELIATSDRVVGLLDEFISD